MGVAGFALEDGAATSVLIFAPDDVVCIAPAFGAVRRAPVFGEGDFGEALECLLLRQSGNFPVIENMRLTGATETLTSARARRVSAGRSHREPPSHEREALTDRWSLLNEQASRICASAAARIMRAANRSEQMVQAIANFIFRAHTSCMMYEHLGRFCPIVNANARYNVLFGS